MIIILCAFPFIGNAQWRIVLDPRAVAQLEANTAMQLGVETAHNQQLDTILTKQQEILEKSAAISAAKELTLTTLKNIEGFGEESAYYKAIGSAALQISELSPQVITAIRYSNIENKVAMATKVGDLVSKATLCVNDFVSIVNNAKVKNPMGNGNSAKNDGHNLLDRYERITLANTIVTDLNSIKRQLNGLLALAEYGTWADAVHNMDRKTWAAMYSGKMHSERLKQQWKSVKK